MTAQPSTNDAVLVDRYYLFREIAAGGMASIQLARLLGPVGFGRTVAVKRLHAHYAKEPGFVAMFLDEANIMTSIRHPNVVPVLDVVALPGQLCLVMEYVHGDSLFRLANAAGGKVPPAVLSAIAIDTLDGLHAAHEAKGPGGRALDVIHRDVSPQNILVGVDGHARVVDFGIAKATSQLHDTTAAGGHKGKLRYMAPEQLDGRPVDRRADVWAAGVVLWESLIGKRLFHGDNDGVLIHRVLEMPIPMPSSVDPALAAWDAPIARALARDAAERFPDARSMALAIEAARPPAATRDVSRWVEEAGRATLDERQLLLDELEAIARSGMPSVRSQLAVITDQAAVSGIVDTAVGTGGDDATRPAGGRPAAPSSASTASSTPPLADDATRAAGGRPVVRSSVPPPSAAAGVSDAPPPIVPASVAPPSRSITPRRGAFLAGLIAAGVALPILALAAGLALTRRSSPVAATSSTTTTSPVGEVSPSSIPSSSPSVPSASSATGAASPTTTPTPVPSATASGRAPTGRRPRGSSGAPDDGIRLDKRK